MLRRILIFQFLLFCFHSGFSQDWSWLQNSPNVTGRFDDIYFVNDTIGWAVNGKGEIYKTTGKDKPWAIQFNTGRYNRSIEFLDDLTGFAGTVDSAVYKTTNGGQDWVRIDKEFPVGVPGVCGMSHHGDAILMVGTYFASPFVIRSFNRGTTWSYTDMSPLVDGLIDTWYKSVDTVFVSGIDHDGRGVVLRSPDAGNTWAVITPLNTVPKSFAWKLDFPTPSVGYVSLEEVTINDVLTGQSTHILKSVDGGRTWIVKEVGIGKNINLQGLGFINANRGWIGGWSTGMYETDDGGDHWHLVNSFANLNRFFFIRSDLAYFSGRSIYQFHGGTLDGVGEPAPSKDVHSLEIFPNPATHETTARITLGVPTMAVLSLQDISGRMIREICRGYEEAGVHDFVIDIKDLAIGEYALVLLTHEHFLGRKLVKIKN